LPKNWAEKLLNLDNNFREIGYFTCGEASVEFNNSEYNALLKSKPYKHF